MESMGVASGCGCKKVYRFPYMTYPYSSCIYLLFQQHPYFCSFFICFSFLYLYFLGNLCNNFSRSINTHTGDYGRPTEAI